MSAALVYLEWKDHCMHGNWADDVDSFHGPAHVKTVGWILKEDDEGITVAQSVNGGEEDPQRNPGNLIYLLKSCVVRRILLSVS